ncbi:PKS-ER domain-containing protein [Fusarium keratoplasticum]|nr:PKS-ER domain-containing protein [Fusarium keratoplasticum]
MAHETLPERMKALLLQELSTIDVTVWNAIKQTGLKKGYSIGIVGIGGLGVLAIHFAKALGYQVVAIDNRDVGLRLAAEVPSHLKPNAIVKFGDEEAAKQISDLTRDIGLHGAVACTDDVEASDWALHQLRPRGVCVVLGLPEQSYKFDAFNPVFREIVVKGSIFTNADEAREMLEVVGREGVLSHLTVLKLEEREVPMIRWQHMTLITG